MLVGGPFDDIIYLHCSVRERLHRYCKGYWFNPVEVPITFFGLIFIMQLYNHYHNTML